MGLLDRLILAPTPPERLCDAAGRPYFLWDTDTTLAQFEAYLADPDPQVRAYWLGKLMRQAKPDDVFRFITPEALAPLLPAVTPYLGRQRAFWEWIFGLWEAHNLVQR